MGRNRRPRSIVTGRKETEEKDYLATRITMTAQKLCGHEEGGIQGEGNYSLFTKGSELS